ncbi:MAG: hypothetical protein Q9208_008023 [Pyrenodesmia sp. 3 TL-2023]
MIVLRKPEIEKTAATMIVAGSETTGTCLAGILNHVLKDRQVKEKLAHEIRAQYSSSDEIDEESLARLLYLGAVIQEGLRIAPPVPTGMPRVVPAGGAQVCGHWLPTDVSHDPGIHISTCCNPEKHHAFLPSRWLEESDDRRDALQPFSMGPRNCIGQRLALMQVRMILAKLFWHFNVETVEGKPQVVWPDQKVFTLWEKEPGWVRLRARKD